MGRTQGFMRFLVRTAVPAALLAVLAGCAQSLPQSPLDPEGPVARAQFEILNLTMWMAMLVGVAVFAIVLYTVWRFRSRPGQSGEPAQIHGNTKFEIAWTLIPIVILAIIAVPTVQKAFYIDRQPDDAAVVVNVRGHQWWWEFEYPDLGFTTANEFHIPVGKTVRVNITSDDVIHSFWVPKLAGKRDANPGGANVMWLQADTAGEYHGQCAEFCGLSHAKMKFRVIAESPAQFDTYVAYHKERQQAAPTYSAAVARGEQIFMGEKPCFTCHAIDGTKAKGIAGPNLTDVGQRTTIAAGWLANNPENLKKWINDPASIKPGAKMPAFAGQLSEADMNALVAFLQAQQP